MNNNPNHDNQYEQPEINYKAVSMKPKSRAWSVASLILSIISILCCCSPIVAITSGVVALVCAIISRKTLGYFDGLSIAGLICAIFGLVFGICGIATEYIIQSDPELKKWYESLLEEIKKGETELIIK